MNDIQLFEKYNVLKCENVEAGFLLRFSSQLLGTAFKLQF